MFEDQGKKMPPVPGNLPTGPAEPADMFGEVEKDLVPMPPNALKSGMLKPAQPARLEVMPRLEQSDQMGERPNVGKIIFLIFIIALVGGLGYGGWFVWGKFRAGGIALPISKNKPAATTTTTTPPVATTGVGNQSSDILFGDVDSDGDGLSNAEEKAPGTDEKNSDTDGDGLSDGDEVRIWRTDPLKKDSDDDGFDDGSEIKNGYDPLAKGELLLNPPLLVVRFVTNTPSGTSTVNYETFVITTR